MKKILCVFLFLIFGFENATAAEVARLYLIENANSQQIKTLFKPAFNKIGYNLIEQNYYQIYENPAQNLFNIIVLKPNGDNCYYYYLSNENQSLNKELLTILDDYGYDYKRIRGSAFLDLFYNDATDFLAKSKSSIRTVSSNNSQYQAAQQQTPPQYEEYDFSDEAQQRFDNGQIARVPQQPIQITPSNVLVGSLVHIEAGTQFNAVLSSGISSESISNNDRISAQLMEDWMFNGIVIAPAGSIVNGNVIDSKPASFAMGNGRIGINFNQILTPDGKVINLSTNKVYIVGDSSRAANIAKRVAGGVLGGVAIASLALLFGADVKSLIGGAAVGGALGTVSALGTKGEDIDVPEGTNLQIMLAEPMTVQPYTSL